MTQQRLPAVNGDDGVWGNIIRQFLMKEHYNDDTDNPTYNGGHQNITIRAGTTGAAPLTFSSTSGGVAAALLTSPVAGAMEYDGTYFYLTEGSARKRVMGFATNTLSSGTSYTVSTSDTVVFANAGSTNVTITLPAASGAPGYRFYVKRVDSSSNTCTVATNGTDLLDGLTSTTLPLQYQAIGVVSNGSAWYIL